MTALENDILNTAFYEDSEDENTTHIDSVTSYAKHSNFYCVHNLNEESAEKLMNNLNIGSWILWIYKDDLINKKLNAITIKTNEGLVHHKNFIFEMYFQKPEVYEVSITHTIINQKIDGKLYIRKEYKTMKEFLEKLNRVYGLDLDKQVIYEDDNDFC
jgi:DNA-directed RNA polymerase subunit H (RpoH/RPB5)